MPRRLTARSSPLCRHQPDGEEDDRGLSHTNVFPLRRIARTVARVGEGQAARVTRGRWSAGRCGGADTDPRSSRMVPPSSGSGRSCTAPPSARGCTGLLVGQLGELTFSFVELQPGDVLVQLLRQDVHADRVLLRPAAQFDLRQHLVRERRTHHVRRVAGAAAQVHQPALGQQDDPLAVREDDVIDLRLDLLPRVLPSDATSISLSKWPMLHTMALFFIAFMWACVITLKLPVVVTKMSALSAAYSIVTTR